MMEQGIRSAYLRELHERLVKGNERARSVAGDLSLPQLNWKPGEDKWSVGQCLEHLLVSVRLYTEKLKPGIENARERRFSAPPDAIPRHRVFGRLLIGAVEPTAKRPISAPKIFAPAASDVGGDVLDSYMQAHEVLAQQMMDSDGLDLSRIKLGSPVIFLIRLNAADAFEIVVIHGERHLNQAERVRQSPGFPH